MPGHFQGAFEVGIGLAGETDDDVGGQRGAVKGVAHAVGHLEIIFACVLAVHPPEQWVRPALQGQVEMRDDLRMGPQGGDEAGVQVARLQAGETQPFQPGDTPAQGVGEFGEGGMLASFRSIAVPAVISGRKHRRDAYATNSATSSRRGMRLTSPANRGRVTVGAQEDPGEDQFEVPRRHELPGFGDDLGNRLAPQARPEARG